MHAQKLWCTKNMQSIDLTKILSPPLNFRGSNLLHCPLHLISEGVIYCNDSLCYDALHWPLETTDETSHLAII